MSTLKVCAAALLASTIAGSVMAADLPSRKAAIAEPIAAPVFTWTGFYLGANLGYYSSSQSGVFTGTPGFGLPAITGAGIAGLGQIPTYHPLGASGVIGGVHAGFNYQLGMIVAGVEGDFDIVSRSRTAAQFSQATFGGAPAGLGFANGLTSNNDYLASVRGRLGFAFNQFLIYATGGVALTSGAINASSYSINVIPPVATNGAWSNGSAGYVLGGGVEWAFMPNWVARAEFLHYEFPSRVGTLSVVSTSNCPVGGCAWVVSTTGQKFNTGRVGVSYKFGWGDAPVVARY